MAFPLKTKINTILKLFFEPKVLSALLSLRISGYLVSVGWFNAFKSGKSVDRNNKPLPWTTYSFIDFIGERLNDKMKMFEYGSGYSTLYFANKVGQLVSIEHNIKWFETIKKIIPSNVKLTLKSEETVKSYVQSINDSNENYDIIFIDSLFRSECCQIAVDHLSDKGIIILDDSERNEYQSGIISLIDTGFKKIDFWGISPGYLYRKSTSIFYRTDNCIGI
jgi:hypothetical protein